MINPQFAELLPEMYSERLADSQDLQTSPPVVMWEPAGLVHTFRSLIHLSTSHTRQAKGKRVCLLLKAVSSRRDKQATVGVLMRCVPHGLQHLNTWFIFAGAIWEGLGGGTLLEEVHFRGGGVEGIKKILPIYFRLV